MPYDCCHCDYKSSTLTSLSQHIRSVHEGAKYVCDQCHNKTTCLSYLQLHKRSIHVIELWVHSNLTGLTRTASYVCYHCDNRVTEKSDQQRHLRSKHDKGLAKTSMIAFCVIIVEIIRICQTLMSRSYMLRKIILIICIIITQNETILKLPYPFSCIDLKWCCWSLLSVALLSQW